MRRWLFLLLTTLVPPGMAQTAVDEDIELIAAINQLNLAYEWIFPVSLVNTQKTLQLKANGQFILTNRRTGAVLEQGSWDLLNSNLIRLKGKKQQLLRLQAQHISLLLGNGQESLVLAEQRNADGLKIENENWRLDRVINLEFRNRIYYADERGINLQLNFAQHSIAGNAGCNSYSGSFLFNSAISNPSQQLQFSALNSSLLNCGSAELMELEQTYLEQLKAVRYFNRVDDLIVLSNAKHQDILFFKPLTQHNTALATVWQPINLFNYDQQLRQLQADLAQPLSLEFKSAQVITGFAGCNSFKLKYNLFASKHMQLYGFSIGKRHCSKPLMQLEEKYLAIFKQTSLVEVRKDSLQLFDANQNLLMSFKPFKH